LLRCSALGTQVEPKLDAKLEGHRRKTVRIAEEVWDEHAAGKSTQSAGFFKRMMVNVNRRRRETLWNQP
jgi:hypothetical protein